MMEKKPYKREYSIDIFKVLENIDRKNYDFLKTLTDEQYEDIQPYTLLRWEATLSNSGKDHETINKRVNERVNKGFWNLSKYKDLQWKLLCSAGCGRALRHSWIAKTKESFVGRQERVMREFYKDLTDEEFGLKFRNMTKDQLEDIRRYVGEADRKTKR